MPKHKKKQKRDHKHAPPVDQDTNMDNATSQLLENEATTPQQLPSEIGESSLPPKIPIMTSSQQQSNTDQEIPTHTQQQMIIEQEFSNPQNRRNKFSHGHTPIPGPEPA